MIFVAALKMYSKRKNKLQAKYLVGQTLIDIVCNFVFNKLFQRNCRRVWKIYL